MSTVHVLQNSLDLNAIIDRRPLTVTSETPLLEVVALLNQSQGEQSCVLVLQDSQLVGIFTARDLLRAIATQANLQGIAVATVMTSQPQTLVLSADQTVMSALRLLQQQHIEHLPILDDRQQLLGVVTQSRLLGAVEDALEQRLLAKTAKLALRNQQLQAEITELQFQKYALDQSALVAMTDRDGVITDVNQRFCQVSQYSAAELLGNTHRIVNSGYHPPAFFQEMWATITSGQVWRGEIKNKAKDGSFYWVATTIVPFLDDCGQPFQYLAIRFDISDRKAGEQKIQQQAALIDVTTDAIIVRNLENQIQLWNRGAEDIYGWNRQEVIGRQAQQLFYPDAPPEPAVEEAFSIVLQQGVWQGELHKKTKTGQEVVVESRWTLMRDEANRPQAILSVETDITDKKLLEKQFLRAQRLESLGTLASGIAHDLNNVLTPILGVAQLLPQTLPSVDERNQKLLTMLVESAKRGSNLVKQILTFARGMDGQRTVLQVRHILTEIVSVARQTFPTSIDIILDVATADLWLVNVDATQIHQVLMNLFVNARDAMPNGGLITATAENLEIDLVYAKMHLNAQVGSYVMISVADTGIGMTSEVLDRIFEPFFTTKKAGTGLGLSTVLGIVKSHGGFINVYSEVDRGSRFNIYLPAVVMNESEPAIEQPRLYDGQGRLILVVDDEAAVREITKNSLEAYNYRVLLANDGVEAISLYNQCQLYSQQQDKVAAVLLDMTMPMLNTPATIRSLKLINPQVAIVAMSGLAANREVVNSAGVSAFLTKPFTTVEMLQVLEETIS